MWLYVFWNCFPAIIQQHFSTFSYFHPKDVRFSLAQVPFWLIASCFHSFWIRTLTIYVLLKNNAPYWIPSITNFICTTSRASMFSTKWTKNRESRSIPSEMIKLSLIVWKLRNLENVFVSLTKTLITQRSFTENQWSSYRFVETCLLFLWMYLK